MDEFIEIDLDIEEIEAEMISNDVDIELALTGENLVLDAELTQADHSTGTFDHRLLNHRDESNQHPISSITNLESSLSSKLDENNTIIIDCGSAS